MGSTSPQIAGLLEVPKGGPGRFTGKVAVVTGANDRGIGGAIAERLADEGAAVMMLAPQEPPRLTKRLRRKGARFGWSACDVTDSAQVRLGMDACLREFGGIDVVVNNAGTEQTQPLADSTDEQWERLIEVNLNGAARVTRAALAHLSDGGVVVNIASVLGLAGCSGCTAYSASKAGLIGMTQSLAWELAPRGIRCVCVAPGMVHTPMVHRHVDQLDERARRQIEACHPLGVGMPQDVAAAVAFLASGDARWITGITLPLGWTNSFPLPTEKFNAPAAEVRRAA